MKIGLLSYHRNYNYGWNLQCYALMTVLKNMGHDVTLIDKRKFCHQKFSVRVKTVLIDILVFIRLREKHKTYEEEQVQRGRNVASFFEKYINPKTHSIYNRKGYKNIPHFDVFIVGSDQVWRSKLVYPVEDYYFKFINYPAKFISYAASFGVDYKEYSKAEIKRCGELIEKFIAVSVRETSGIELIKDVYQWKCDPVMMPDPTLLLTKNEYKEIVKNEETEKETANKGLFCYILDQTDDKMKVTHLLSDNFSLIPSYLCLNENKINPSVEDWLYSFMNAKFVFTDSFHGCVFSLIFRKPFIVYGNEQRGLARFTSLLDCFNQQKRLIKSSLDLHKKLLMELRYMDTKQIDVIQNDLREKALNYLRTNIDMK